jgi:hypothetical protein
MPHPIESHYVQQFSSNLKLLLQQEDSRLSPYVTVGGGHTGEQASPVDQLGAITSTEVVGRFNPMSNIEVPTDRRWILPRDFQVPILLDSKDKLRLLVDPTGSYSQLALAALNRRKDEVILSSMFSTNQTGKAGGTSTALPSSQVVGVNQGAASATNLTVAKLKRAIRILMSNNVNMSEQVYCAINAAAHESLMSEPEIINGDYNNTLVLVNGKVDQFLGVKFIHTELLTTGTDDQSGTSTQIPLWVKSGMYMGMWEDIMTDISVRNDLESLPTQVYAKATFGACRLEEKKIVRIWAR